MSSPLLYISDWAEHDARFWKVYTFFFLGQRSMDDIGWQPNQSQVQHTICQDKTCKPTAIISSLLLSLDIKYSS